MPDEILILKSLAGAAVVAAIVALLTGWPWGRPRPAVMAAGSALGVGCGIAVGVWILGAVPHYPPREDQDRLLLILLPAAVAAEIIAAVLDRWRWATWLPRLAVAAAAARVLLHGSVYISGSATEPLAWSPSDVWLILGGLAAAVVVEWALLDALARREANRGVTGALALTSGVAGLTVMLSGYASGGQLGFPIAAALAGAAIASLCFTVVDLRGALGVGLVGLFALLVVGRFFGDLTTTNALLLFLAPLLGWLPELPRVLRSRPIVRGGSRLLLVAVPVALALVLAVIKFQAASRGKSPPPGAGEPSPEDYLNFGK